MKSASVRHVSMSTVVQDSKKIRRTSPMGGGKLFRDAVLSFRRKPFLCNVLAR